MKLGGIGRFLVGAMHSFVALVMTVVALACACSRRSPPPEQASERRIVSLAPSTTEALFALGAGDQVVGRSRFCDYPAEARRLPTVGGFIDPNLEAIVALRPTLVVGARGPAGRLVVDQLRTRGMSTFFPPTESLDEILVMLQGLGERTGRLAESERLTSAIRNRVTTIARAVERRPKPRVLVVFGGK